MKPISDELLFERIADICTPVSVVSLPKRFYNDIPIDWQEGFASETEPVCVAGSLLPSNQYNSFDVFTFYNWLYSGIRIIPNESNLRFEQFKGIGLTLPKAFDGVQPVIEDIFQYKLIPNPDLPESPFGVLLLGSERRAGGVDNITYLLPDVEGYGWFKNDTSVNTPQIRKAVTYSDEFCELTSIAPIVSGQIIRSFINPFRVSDLQLMMLLSQRTDSKNSSSHWQKKAESLLTLSIDLSGCYQDYIGYAKYISKRIGGIAASLIHHRVWHRLLTEHCQNMTLAGELTEFSRSVKIPDSGSSFSVEFPNYGVFTFEVADAESRLYSQVLLLANHARHFIDCMKWVGIELNDNDCVFSFVQGMKDILSEQQVNSLISHFNNDPYCADIKLAIHDRFSADNLKNCDNFIDALRNVIYEELR